MSDAKTTADLFRERGWGAGTKVTRGHGWWEAIAIGREAVFMRADEGEESSFYTLTDWSLYTPTPPVPTQEEWRELWGKLKAWREAKGHATNSYLPNTVALIRAIDAITAKEDAA